MLQRLGTSLSITGVIVMLNTFSTFVTVPMFLSAWGERGYSEWLTLTNVVTSLALFNFGVQTYLTNRLIVHYQRKEIDAGTRVLQAGLRLYIIFSSMVLLTTIYFVLQPNLLGSLHVDTIPANEARLIIFIQGAMVTYTIIDGVIMSILIATEQYPRRLRYSLANLLIGALLPATLALLGASQLRAAMGMGLLTAIVGFVGFRDVYRRSPFRIGIKNATWREARTLMMPSLGFFIISIAITVQSSGLIILISAFNGPVALFSTSIVLTNFVRVLVSQSMQVFWPEITAAGAVDDDPARLSRWYTLTLKIGMVLALIAGGSLIILGPFILGVWTRGRIEVDAILNHLLVVYLLIQIPATISRIYGMALNKQNKIIRGDFLLIFGMLALAAILIQPYGIRGVAIGLCIAQIIGTLWFINACAHWTHTPIMRVIHTLTVQGALTLLATGGLILLAIGLPGLLEKMVFLAIAIVTCLYVSWRTWFNKAERQQAEVLLMRVSQRFGKRLPAGSQSQN
jgi:O-antigen/teichoic acid export membrane protein